VTSINVALADPADAAAFSRTIAARSRCLARAPLRGGELHLPVNDRFTPAIAAVTWIGSTAFTRAHGDPGGGAQRYGRYPSADWHLAANILTEVIIEGLLVALAGAVFGWPSRRRRSAVELIFQARMTRRLVFVRVTPSIVPPLGAVAVPWVGGGAVASWMLLRRSAAALVRR